MKKTTLLCLAIAVLMLLSSCQSIYSGSPETTQDPEYTTPVQVDVDGEYFTKGNIDLMGTASNGYYYNGAWIYPELQWGVVEEIDSQGHKQYIEKQIKRLVKYNPYTGEVSSLCLNPTCNHSPGSDCKMIISEIRGVAAVQTYLNSYTVYDDWLICIMGHHHPDYGLLKYTELYNLKTGELKSEFAPDVGDFVMNVWDGGSYFEGKLYKIKKTLDYTNTGYDPDGDVSASKFTPETVFTLCEFDLETHKLKELFEVPNYYGLQTVSNKRFYFAGLDDDYYYSCTRDGKDFRREDVRTIRTDEIIGTYVYQYNFTGFSRYDLTTNTQINYEPNFPLLSYPVVTNNGIYYSTYTTLGDINNSDGPSEDQTDEEWADEMEKIMFSGTAQIWRSDYDGNNMELVFEKENANIDIMFVDDKFAYVCYETDPTSSDYNKGRSVINLETGAITPIPYLEMILPPGYIPEE